MSLISIRADELIMAFEHHDALGQHYLDRQSGEVLYISEDIIDEDEMKQLEAEPDRYLLIEPIPSYTGFQIMADFVDSLPEGRASRELANALRQRHPFRLFKDALLGYPSLREDWFRFHEKAFLEIIREWLEENEVEVEVSPFYPENAQE